MELFEQMRKKKKWRDRINIAWEIEKIVNKGREDLVEPIIMILTKEKESRIRSKLVDILTKIGTDSAVEGIKQRLNDKDDFIAGHVIEHLSKIKTDVSFQAIKEILVTTKNQDLLRDGLSALYDRIYGYHSSGFESEREVNLDLYIDALKKFQDKSKIHYLYRLGDFSKKFYFEKCLAALKHISQNHPNPDFRKEAADTIGKMSQRIQMGGSEYDINKNGRVTITSLGEGLLSKANWANHATKVKELEIFGSRIKSLSGIEPLTELTKLFIRLRERVGTSYERKKTALEDISALSHCPNLIKVDLSMSNISNLDGLADHPNLREIDLSDNEIETLKGLTNLPNLISLNLAKNKLTEISGLDDLTSLEHLDLSYNKVSQISGLQNLDHLLTINLVGNPDLGQYRLEDAQKLVAKCAGVSFGPDVSLSLSKPTIHPFKHVLLENNVEDRCLYCKNHVAPVQNQQAKCEKKLRKIISSANRKIPTKEVIRIQRKAPSSRLIVGKDGNYITVRDPGIYDKIEKLIGNLNGRAFSALAGTICESCSEQFLESAKKIFKRINTKGSKEQIEYSISNVEKSHKSLIKEWIRKI